MGALVGVDSKPPQENLPWHKYQWRLCMSYQKRNQVIRPFILPIYRCDDSVQDIDTEENYFIAVDMDSWHCPVVSEEKTAQKTVNLHPGREAALESDAYGGPKFSSNICINYYEATSGMVHTSQITWCEKCCIKNYC